MKYILTVVLLIPMVLVFAQKNDKPDHGSFPMFWSASDTAYAPNGEYEVSCYKHTFPNKYRHVYTELTVISLPAKLKTFFTSSEVAERLSVRADTFLLDHKVVNVEYLPNKYWLFMFPIKKEKLIYNAWIFDRKELSFNYIEEVQKTVFEDKQDDYSNGKPVMPEPVKTFIFSAIVFVFLVSVFINKNKPISMYRLMAISVLIGGLFELIITEDGFNSLYYIVPVSFFCLGIFLCTVCIKLFVSKQSS